MIWKKNVPMLTKREIARLKGGPLHNFRYFLGLSENWHSDVFAEVDM